MAQPMPYAYLPPDARPRHRGTAVLRLTRRGTRHGYVLRQAVPPHRPTDSAQRWQQGRPILLRGILRQGLPSQRAAIARTLRMFERLRRGARFLDEMQRRLRGVAQFALAGSTVDLGDQREIEKVYVDRLVGRRRVARDLYAKLSWIAHDTRDVSLRIRFSFGVERLAEWQGDPRRARCADDFAARVFPEALVLIDCEPLRATLDQLATSPVRLSERIVYNNVPAGGAVFHHDAEPTQLGVCFGQLQGTTAWLALPRHELAREVAALRRQDPRRVNRTLDDPDEPRLYRILNHDPRLTARLVARGALFVLRAGDALLLPSPSPAVCAWHSVFGVGARPSLAHSYGVFYARAGR